MLEFGPKSTATRRSLPRRHCPVSRSSSADASGATGTRRGSTTSLRLYSSAASIDSSGAPRCVCVSPPSEAAKVAGATKVPYLADEDPELRGDDTPLARRAKDAFLARGKPMVLQKIREFVAAVAKGGPAKDELESKKTAPAKAAAAPPVKGDAPAPAAPAPAVKEKKAKGKDKEGFKTIEMTEKFYCRAKDMYEILMDENRWKGFTQSNARISREVGGEFSLFDGSITGVNEELQEGKLISQKWRFGSWPDGLYSSVRLVFDEPESGVTIIKLKQTDVPEEDKYGNATVVENTERGWRELIFQRIRGVFGFGI